LTYVSEQTGVADPGCFSQIPDPDFYTSRIPDPKTATKERGEKFFVVIPCFVATKYHKIENYFIFEMLKRKNMDQFSKNRRELFTQKLSLSSHKYGFEIRDLEKTYSGSRIQGSKRRRIPDPYPQHWKKSLLC
jgi:hypothetical protein